MFSLRPAGPRETPAMRPVACRPSSLLNALTIIAAAIALLLAPDAFAEGPRIVDDGGDPAPPASENDSEPATDPVDDAAPAASESPGCGGRHGWGCSVGARTQWHRPAHTHKIDFGVAGLVFVGLDDWLDNDDVGESGGATAIFRWRFARRWALAFDASIAVRDADQNDARETRIQHSIGVMWYPFVWNRLSLFLSGGLTGGWVHLEDEPFAGDESEYLEGGGYLGFGADWRFKDFTVTAEVRGMKQHRADRDELRAAQAAGLYDPEAPESRPAMMFNVGVLYGW